MVENNQSTHEQKKTYTIDEIAKQHEICLCSSEIWSVPLCESWTSHTSI